MKRIIIFLAICAFGLAGCTTNTAKNVQIETTQKLEHHLYGKLEKGAQGYSFTMFSENYNRNEPWVRLGDFQPMWSTKKEWCTIGIEFNQLSKPCRSENPTLFREKGTDFTLKRTAGYAVLSVLSFGLLATMPPGSVEFDQDKYFQAVNQANRKLHKRFEGLGVSHTSYHDLLHEYDSAMSNFEATHKIKSSDYKAKVPKPIISLSDKSGLFNGTEETFQKFVAVNRNRISGIDSVIKKQAVTLDNLVLIAEERNKQALSELSKKTSNLLVSCRNNALREVKYTLKCPQTVLSSENSFNIQAVVHSIDYKKVIPTEFTAEDNTLELNMKSGSINVINKTDSFVSIDSLSFYHNGKIASQYKLGSELPPESEKDIIRINSLPVDWEHISFTDVTKGSANSKKIEYGFAVKYKIVDTNREKTLLKKSTYKLLDLIASR